MASGRFPVLITAALLGAIGNKGLRQQFKLLGRTRSFLAGHWHGRFSTRSGPRCVQISGLKANDPLPEKSVILKSETRRNLDAILAP
jgi:hypothetical protein